MSDLTDKEIQDWMQLSDSNSPVLVNKAAATRDLLRALAELQRHRSALAAGGERVRSVVRQAIVDLGISQYGGYFVQQDGNVQGLDAIATRAAEQLATARPAWAPNKEHVRTIVDNAVIDVASVGPPLRSTNLRMMSAAIADRVADALAPSPSKSDPVDDESDYEKRNRELHRLGRLAGKP